MALLFTVTSGDLCGEVFFLLLITQDPGSQFTEDSQLMPVHHHHEAFITLLKELCWDC